MATATTTTIKILLDSIEGGKQHYREIATHFTDDDKRREPCNAGIKKDGTPSNAGGHNWKLDVDMISKFPGDWTKAGWFTPSPKGSPTKDGAGLPKTQSPKSPSKWNKAKADDRRYAVHVGTHPTLCVIDWDDGTDIDDPRIPELWKAELPYTFSSGAKDHTGKGLHFYCYCEGMPEGAPDNQVKCLTIGDCDVMFRYSGVFEKPGGEVLNWNGSIPEMHYDDVLKPHINATEFLPTEPDPVKVSSAITILEGKQPTGDLTEDDIVSFLTHIDPGMPSISKEEGNWISVGSFLKYAEDTDDVQWDKHDAQDLFVDWSAGKFWADGEPDNFASASDCKKKWKHFAPHKVQLSTIIFYAKRTAGGRAFYDEWKQKKFAGQIRSTVRATFAFADDDYSDMMETLMEAMLACPIETKKDNKLYLLGTGGIWLSLGERHFLKKIKTELQPRLLDIKNSYENLVADAVKKGDEDAKDRYIKLRDLYRNALLQMKNDPAKKRVFATMTANKLEDHPTFEPFLLGFLLGGLEPPKFLLLALNISCLLGICNRIHSILTSFLVKNGRVHVISFLIYIFFFFFTLGNACKAAPALCLSTSAPLDFTSVTLLFILNHSPTLCVTLPG
eukprot:SAG22_NODE_960_length_6295_cov_76.270497_3_plen_616_part_00